MSGGSWKRLEELFAAALECPPEERRRYLDQACEGDPGLRREVEELLGADDEAVEFFDALSSDIVAAAPGELETAAQPKVQIGPYRTLQVIGHGGMGAVYRAVRVDGAFDQQVALKLLHLDMETPQLRARFLAERQLLAHLSHPNIARLQDGGVSEEGRPYFVMEYVDGVPITQYCEQMALPVESILRLLLVVIEAVSYLHRNLVVHRDLKPSNIFVDRDGQVKLLDFGIAKLLADDPEVVGRTRTGEQLLTPEYAAPEQLVNAPVTTATDVYALGVVLYELLTGYRPHDRSSMDLDSILNELPPTPSAKLRSRRKDRDTARRRQNEVGRETIPAPSRRQIAGDLDTICLEALRPEPEARYPSAEQLGQDIERHLDGLPVRARKSTFGYRLTKYAQRHRRGFAAVIAVLVLVAAGFGRERGLRGEAEQARLDAQREAAKAVAVSDFLGELLSSVDPKKAQGQEVTVANVLDEAAERLAAGDELAEQPSVEAAVRLTIGNTYTSLGKYADGRAHLERALELRGGIEARDPEALEAAEALGVSYHRQGLFDQAETLLRMVLEVRTDTLGEDHPASLTALSHLADLLWAAGRFDEVEPLDRKTLEIRRRVLGEDHPDTLRSLNGLAATLFSGARYAEAAELFEQALPIQRRQLGENHPDTLMLGSNLAAAYLELGRYPEAESLLREVVNRRGRVLGEDHEDTATSVHNLGMTLAQQARYEEAESHLLRAIEARQRISGGQRNSLFSRSYLADVYRDQGRHREAEALYRSTLQQQRDSFGPEDPATLKTASGLAELLLRQGEVAAAETLITEVLDVQSRVRGEEHPDTLLSLTTLARVRIAQGRWVEAQELSERAVEAGSRTLGANHLEVLATAFESARALRGQGHLDAALEVTTGIYEVRAKVLGREHPGTVEALMLVTSLQEAMAGGSVDGS